MKPTDKDKAMESSASALVGMRLDPERARKIPIPIRKELEKSTGWFRDEQYSSSLELRFRASVKLKRKGRSHGLQECGGGA
ncbi:MAG: hypothetical protein F4128_03615 [Gammaproteobacteria bacterium]|nr:hypothetical protein [Gammaproteobacteria bacterium]